MNTSTETNSNLLNNLINHLEINDNEFVLDSKYLNIDLLDLNTIAAVDINEQYGFFFVDVDQSHERFEFIKELIQKNFAIGLFAKKINDTQFIIGPDQIGSLVKELKKYKIKYTIEGMDDPTCISSNNNNDDDDGSVKSFETDVFNSDMSISTDEERIDDFLNNESNLSEWIVHKIIILNIYIQTHNNKYQLKTRFCIIFYY